MAKQTFPQKLIKLRESREWTQYRLAVVAGLSREGVRKIEAGKVQPTMATLGKLATAFEMTVAGLIRKG